MFSRTHKLRTLSVFQDDKKFIKTREQTCRLSRFYTMILVKITRSKNIEKLKRIKANLRIPNSQLLDSYLFRIFMLYMIGTISFLTKGAFHENRYSCSRSGSFQTPATVTTGCFSRLSMPKQ